MISRNSLLQISYENLDKLSTNFTPKIGCYVVVSSMLLRLHAICMNEIYVYNLVEDVRSFAHVWNNLVSSAFFL